MIDFKFLQKIDYTLLDECIESDIITLCENAIKLNVKSVCVYPEWVSLCSSILKTSSILVCTVIDFPYGLNSLEFRLNQSKTTIESGADELDIVLNHKSIANKNQCIEELTKWAEFCHQFYNKSQEKICLKVIVESGLLSLEETKIATEICIQSKVDFIKTSTGKVGVGAELDKVECMRNTILENSSNLNIKASGGIKTLEQLLDYYKLVERFGMGYKSVDALVENS
jgi:deoxyribose-phosphate aldolase